MATKDSRLAQIYRQELAKNKGLLGAFSSAGGARLKEAVDLRQYLLPQSGISGAISQRMFGKAYRYSSGQPGVRTAGSGSPINDRAVSEKITRVDINTKLTAKNTIVLPAMARDMNLMRMNMQKMVKLSGGTPSTKADMFFKRAGDRESAYESQFKKSSGLVAPTAAAPTQTQNGGLFSGILEFLKMPLFNMFGSLVGMLVKGGLITAVIAGIGSLIRELVNNEDFRKSFTDTVDSVAKSIFGEGVWKNLAVGVAAAGAAFLALKLPLNSLLGIVGSIANGLTGLVGFMIKHPVIFGATVAAGTLAYAVNRIANVPKDDTPLTNKEIAESQQSAASGGFESAQMQANKKRKKISEEIDLANIDSELLKLKEQETQIKNAPRTTKSIGDLGAIHYKMQDLESKKSKLVVNRNMHQQNDRELARTPTQVSAAPSTSPSKQELSSRSSIEAYLGRAISDDELDYLYRATYAESAHSKDSYANVMAVILNRTRKNGKSIIDTLTEENQFQAVTGTKNNPGPSPHFKSGPSEKNLKMLEGASKDILPNVSKNLDSFTATDPKAYVEGTSMAWLDKLKNTQGSFEKSGTLFAENQYNGKYKGAATLTASAKELKPQTPSDKEDSVFGEVTAMLAGVFKAIGATNTSIQSLAVASSAKPQQSASIASPYDKELYELLLAYHSDIATPLGT
jgi:hypothetical protein